MTSDKENSIVLANLCGWEYRFDGITGEWWQGDEKLYDEWTLGKDGYGVVTPLDLYDPANMALAWRVLNHFRQLPVIGASLDDWWMNDDGVYLTVMIPADAQRAWLDKVLELAREAGMLQVESG